MALRGSPKDRFDGKERAFERGRPFYDRSAPTRYGGLTGSRSSARLALEGCKVGA